MKTNQTVRRYSGTIIWAFFAIAALQPDPTLAQSEGLLEKIENAFVEIAEKTMPVVVNVTSTKAPEPSAKKDQGGSGDTRPQFSQSAGIIVSKDGHILTAFHGVKDMIGIKVALSDGRSFNAKLMGTDPGTDLAVIKVEAQNLPTAVFGDSGRVRVGALVIGVGNPFGLKHSISVGVVSSTERANDLIQTDAVVTSGSGGGPLVNIRGEVVGIMIAELASSDRSWRGFGFAVPSNKAKWVMDQLMTSGEVRRGLLGAKIQNLSEDMVKVLGRSDGAVVVEVISGSPAEAVGVKVNDIIFGLDGRQVKGANHLQNMIAQSKPGSQAILKIYREGKEIELTFTVGERPKEPPAPATPK